MMGGALKMGCYLALRFVLRHRRKTIATGSFIVLGTVVLVFLHALTVGINDTMVLNTTRLHYGNLFVSLPPGQAINASTLSQIRSLSGDPQALMRYRFSVLARLDGNAAPVVVYAVDPSRESTTTAVAKRIQTGTYPHKHQKEILLGHRVAQQLDAVVGDRLSLIGANGRLLEQFTLSGTFQTDIDYFDNTIGYLPLGVVDQDVIAAASGEIAVFFPSAVDASPFVKPIKNMLPHATALKTWQQLMPDLVQLIQLNQTSAHIIMVFVFILVGFGISNSFVLTIVERFREFGILKAMGLTSRELVGLIFLESFSVCIAASLIGLTLAYGLIQLVAINGIDFSVFTSHNRYFVVSGRVFPRATAAGFLWPGIMALGVSILSAYLPTRVAARKTAAETLRFT